ncbi:MAG: D-alanine--D-alanine ligase [Bacillota bacterium]
MKARSVGIVLETKEDAVEAVSNIIKDEKLNIDDMYHWREPEEIDSILRSIRSFGFEARLIGTPDNLAYNLRFLKNNVDFIFNLSVGFKKRFRLALGPALYETAGIPYSGADPYTKMVSQNKHLMKSLWDKMNIPTPPWVYVDSLSGLEELVLPDFPLIVKPAYEGSSIGINANAVSYDREGVTQKIKDIIETLRIPVIVEKFIPGKEYKIGIIGNKNKKFFGMIEDVKRDGSSLKNDFIYFNAKTYGMFYKVRRDIDKPEFEKLKRDCEAIYHMFLPVDYGTFDIRVDEAGNHYFLEFNADATLHPQRTLAQCCKLNGLDYENMIGQILKTSFERWGIAWN